MGYSFFFEVLLLGGVVGWFGMMMTEMMMIEMEVHVGTCKVLERTKSQVMRMGQGAIRKEGKPNHEPLESATAW